MASIPSPALAAPSMLRPAPGWSTGSARASSSMQWPPTTAPDAATSDPPPRGQPCLPPRGQPCLLLVLVPCRVQHLRHRWAAKYPWPGTPHAMTGSRHPPPPLIARCAPDGLSMCSSLRIQVESTSPLASRKAVPFRTLRSWGLGGARWISHTPTSW